MAHLRKKLGRQSCGLLAFMLLWGLFGSMIAAPWTAAAEGDPGFNYSVTASTYDLAPGQYIALKVEYEAKKVGAINEGDQITFTLPALLKEVTPKFPQEHIRDCIVTESDNDGQTEVICTFGSDMQTGLKGYMMLEATLSWKAEPGQSVPIAVTIKNTAVTIDVNVVDPGSGGEKDNLIDKWNGNLGYDENHNGVITDPGKPIEYYIRINGGSKQLDNVEVVDYIPPGLELIEGSMRFYADSPYDEENLLEPGPQWNVDNNEIHVSFGSIDRPYFIKYEMKIVELKPEYNNSAKITANNEKEYTAEIVKLGKKAGAINVLKKADKEQLPAGSAGQIVTYMVQFYSFGEFGQGSIVVTDVLDSRGELIEDSIVVSEPFSYSFDPAENKLTVVNDKRGIQAGENPAIEFKVDLSRLEPGGKVSNIAKVGQVPTNEVVVEKENPDPGTENPDPGTENPDPGTENPDPGTENPDPGTGNPDPGTGNPDPGTENPDPSPVSPDPQNPAEPIEQENLPNANEPEELPAEGEIITVEDEEIPRGTIEQSENSETNSGTPEFIEADSLSGEIPLGGLGEEEAAVSKLPQTGEAGPEPFYWAGFGLSAAGLLLMRYRKINKR